MRLKKLAAIAAVAASLVALTGCGSRRQIDPEATNSWNVEGTSWYGFCDGPNAFIWIPSRNDTDPDELEAVIYDHYNCVTEQVPADGSTRPDTDPDGLIPDKED
jgi:hypothetical protein